MNSKWNWNFARKFLHSELSNPYIEHIDLGPDFRKIFLRKFLRLNENLRKNLQCWFSKNLKKKLRKTYDDYRAVLGNCEIDYTVVTSTITTMAFILSWQEGSNALLKFDSSSCRKASKSDLIQTTPFPHAAVT